MHRLEFVKDYYVHYFFFKIEHVADLTNGAESLKRLCRIEGAPRFLVTKE